MWLHIKYLLCFIFNKFVIINILVTFVEDIFFSYKEIYIE